MHNVGLAGLTFWAPNINIFRDPIWGRGQETPGEDPTHSAKYAARFVKGLQERENGDHEKLKVAACCKHYTAYDLDNWKSIERYTFNAVVTKQDLADTFQPPFKSCVLNGNATGMMCSYNQVNGKPTCGDPDLLAGVVRGKWELNGYIVTDCKSLDFIFSLQHYTRTPEETAGVDLGCSQFLANYTQGALNKGLVKESEIDRAISNTFSTLMRLGFFDGDLRKQPYGNLGPMDVCTQEHQQLALEAARQGTVLLKNSAGSLPLSTTATKSIAIIGPNANVTWTMLGNYQGFPCKFTSPLQGLTALGIRTDYSQGCDNITCGALPQIDEAKKIAATADAVVLVMGCDTSVENENLDRINITLPGKQSVLISEVAKNAKGPVILVIMSGGGMDIKFAVEDSNITSILWIGYPGEAGGAALANVIFGAYNPGGRLPVTWYPQSSADKVEMTAMRMRPDPSTGYPGRSYRFYDGPRVFDYGSGMSYSIFEHRISHSVPRSISLGRALRASKICGGATECDSLDAAEDVDCGHSPSFDIDLTVRNAGPMRGSHVVLFYSSLPQSFHGAALKQLLDFKKVGLSPEEEATVTFHVDTYEWLTSLERGRSHWEIICFMLGMCNSL